MSHRVFSALPLNVFIPQIESQLASLKENFPEVKWAPLDYFHITLHFFAKLSDQDLKHFQSILRENSKKIASIKLGLEGMGVFPDFTNPKVLWMGLKGDLEALSRSHELFQTILKTAGFPVDDRPFHPHMTVGRITSKTEFEALLDLPEISTPLESFREICLYESRLSSQGTTYEILERFPLSAYA